MKQLFNQILFVALFPCALTAQVQFTASVDSKQVPVGEVFEIGSYVKVNVRLVSHIQDIDFPLQIGYQPLFCNRVNPHFIDSGTGLRFTSERKLDNFFQM